MADSEGRSEGKGGARGRVAEELASSLQELIVEGRIGAGDALPSERELAAKFEVNRSSVREALHRLEAVGLIEMKHGGATRVRDVLVSAGLHLLPFLVARGGRLDPAWLRDLLEVRVMFLSWCGEQAARRASADDVERFEAIAARVAEEHARERRASAHHLMALDWDFFSALVATTNNRVMALLTNVVREVHTRDPARFKALYEGDAFDPRHLTRAVEAVRKRDAPAAAAAMRAHGESALAALFPSSTRGKR
jgi:GntR family transcriptional repressor for pyruvate dehydrogenase complex